MYWRGGHPFQHGAVDETVRTLLWKALSLVRYCLLPVLLLVQPAAAQEPAPEIVPQAEIAPQTQIGIFQSPPFVSGAPGRYEGMAIELWEMVSAELGLTPRYTAYPTLRELVAAVSSGEVDAAVTNLTITRRRAEAVSFSQPWYDSGMRIMVPDEGTSSFGSVVSGLRNAGHLRAYAWLVLVIVVSTILLTLFDRRFDKDFPRRWREGIAESFHHVMSIATTGKASRKNLFGWVGRIWSALWLVCGVAVVAYITSSVTSVMTAVSLEQQIDSLADLPGKTTGVIADSSAEDYLAELGIATRPYKDLDAAVAALKSGRVDAIVGDAPVLEYHAHHNPDDEMTVVGSLFHPDKYGFAFPHESALARQVTLKILAMRESGELEELRLKYFGSTP